MMTILTNLDLINKNILNNYIKSNSRANIWWIDYTRGINYAKKKRGMKAIKSFIRMFYNKSPFIYKFKSLYYLFFKMW